ncbi:MAG: ATP-dependent DNA helicase RecG [Rhodospirillales bacterium]|nr:ATP-dependent DNA helicase RecG [Rhodospirillales bacterium]
MRPQILFPLFAPATALPGLGPRLGKLVENLTGGTKVVDLLWHRPAGLIDRRFTPKVAEAPDGAVATIAVTVHKHEPPPNARRPYRVRCADETGPLDLVFFHAHRAYLEKLLPIGEERVVSGRVEHYQGRVQMTHPDHVGTRDEIAKLAAIEPVYPLTAGLTLKVLTKAIRAALERAPELPEWLDPAYRTRQKWPPWRQAIGALHTPGGEADLAPMAVFRQRLAYDEMLANQLALALVRQTLRKRPGRRIEGDGHLRAKIAEALPYRLTGSQERALAEIAGDLAQPSCMLRLLQGDVGSGKTVVALLAMLIAVEAGAQGVLMAPTEILARQHLAALEPLVQAAGLRIGLLTGREKGKNRQAILDDLASGALPLIVGTHALIEADVVFRDLALAVIDEQHRFGVHQRLDLAGKGRAVDVLVMTATPIPRTLTLTAYGDMDVSRLTEKPPGRTPIDTRAIPLERIEEVISAVARATGQGAKVYWVCPLVEETETSDLAAVTERHAHLAQRFPGKVGLVHGRLKGTEKDRAMADFAQGPIDILVATTVIEVGVDVPAATIMVIEHAERFGLAQLHQLRGRVGRGAKASTCLLLYGQPLGETAKARLACLRSTDDGFVIAEEDLRLRGAGELLGTRQSGLPEFHLADLAVHGDLLATARDDAKLILERDPDLESPRGQALRVLLYLFERDAQVKTLRSG